MLKMGGLLSIYLARIPSTSGQISFSCSEAKEREVCIYVHVYIYIYCKKAHLCLTSTKRLNLK